MGRCEFPRSNSFFLRLEPNALSLLLNSCSKLSFIDLFLRFVIINLGSHSITPFLRLTLFLSLYLHWSVIERRKRFLIKKHQHPCTRTKTQLGKFTYGTGHVCFDNELRYFSFERFSFFFV